jgi:hypothetical protein
MSKHQYQPNPGGVKPPQNSQPVPPANLTSPAPEATKKMFVVNSISDLIAQVEKAGGTLSPEAKVELEKMRTAQETLEAPKRLADAEAEVTLELPKLLETIATKHKVAFSGRKVVVVFKSAPKEGEPNPLVSFGPEVEVIASGKKRTSSGKGFKSHGEVVHHPEEGKEIHYGSFGAMAKTLGWKMEGRANATVAITNPTTQSEWDSMDSEARKNLPTLNRIEAKEADGKVIQHVYPVIAS